MLVTFLLIGGFVGVAYFVKQASKDHVMTLEEWKFQQRNKTSMTTTNHWDDVYRYL